MLEASNNSELATIPGKRYFTIGEVSKLCAVKSHVLRYWEQEFPQLKPLKRRGNRRYYQREDVILIRQIRSLLYEQGFTIGAATALRGRGQGGQQPQPADHQADEKRIGGSVGVVAALIFLSAGFRSEVFSRSAGSVGA